MFYLFLFVLAAVCLFLAERDRRFWRDLTKNCDKFRRPSSKLRVLLINGKNMFRRFWRK